MSSTAAALQVQAPAYLVRIMLTVSLFYLLLTSVSSIFVLVTRLLYLCACLPSVSFIYLLSFLPMSSA